MTNWQIGVDVGGTFTDLLAVDAATRQFRVHKLPSTTDDQSRGFIAGIAALGVEPGAVDALVHGTTVGTNAILERKGAACGLITTRGFRDVLELGRRTRPNAYGMIGSFEPLIPRELRLEVPERVDAEGRVVTALDEAAVRAALAQLIARGTEALVIHFLHSYINPAHELRCAEIARSLWPNDFVTVGSQILREAREFERGSTAALNAYVQPVMSRYLGRLSDRLREVGVAKELLVMQGNGGTMTARLAAGLAVQTVMSGPAAGALAAAHIGLQAGHPNLIACDMGGTSFDVSVILNGQPSVTAEQDIAYGMPIRVPLIDIHTIGAGGGSIARIDQAGLLKVGPESAGALPGPIAYGRGGTEPTVTDANLLLGRLNPKHLTGVGGAPPTDAVRAALERRIGRPLGLDPIGAAAAVLAVAGNQLASAIRLVSIEKGHDPRDVALFAFGGAGPLHATALARELGIPAVLVPRFPGITSALGCILADLRHDFVRTVNQPLESATPAALDEILAVQEAAGRALLAEEAVPVTGIVVTHEADLLYRGQSHLLRIALLAPFDGERVRRDFAARYKQRFDIELAEMRTMLVNLRTTVIGRRAALDLAMFAPPGGSLAAARLGARDVYFAGDWVETPIYRRDALPIDAEIAGPAIVEQADTTVVIDPGAVARVDRLANLVISV